MRAVNYLREELLRLNIQNSISIDKRRAITNEVKKAMKQGKHGRAVVSKLLQKKNNA